MEPHEEVTGALAISGCTTMVISMMQRQKWKMWLKRWEEKTLYFILRGMMSISFRCINLTAVWRMDLKEKAKRQNDQLGEMMRV